MSISLSPFTHSLNVEIAVKTDSASAAIIFHHLFFWISRNKRKNVNQINGRTWMYESIPEIKGEFPYFSERQVKFALQILVDHGFILRGKFSENKFDRRNWYALANEAWVCFEKSNNSKEPMDEPISSGAGENDLNNFCVETISDGHRSNLDGVNKDTDSIKQILLREKQAKDATPSASLAISLSSEKQKEILEDNLVKNRLSSTSSNFVPSNSEIISNNSDNIPYVALPSSEGSGKKVKTKKQFDESSPAFKLSKLLFETRREISPEVLEPDLQKWAKEMDLILRIDGRSETRLQEVIGYLKIQRSESNGTFLWVAVIKSPQNLRKHFETIAIQMDARKRKDTKEDEVHKKFELIEKNKKWAQEMESKISINISPHCSFKILNNMVMFTNEKTSACLPIGFSEYGFKEMIENQVRKMNY